MDIHTSTELDLRTLSSLNYIFTVIRGIQAGREYYIAMCPLTLIPKLFSTNIESHLPVELRAQRLLNKSRIHQITKYILNNPTEYVFSSLVVSIDAKTEFKPLIETSDCKVGLLIVPMTAKFIINDGQHRIAAIKEALKSSHNLARESIPIVFFIYSGLKRSQQMFTDLNKYAVRPSNSLNILYDYRDNIARLTVRLANTVVLFKDRIEFEKTTLSPNSPKLFTLNNLYHSIRALVGNKDPRAKITMEEENLYAEYWNELTNNIKEWKLLLEGEITSSELRRNFIHSHGVALQAFGIIGHELLLKYKDKWKNRLFPLQKMNFSRTNRIWHGRVIINGRISKTYTSLILLTNVLKRQIGLELSVAEERIEKRFKNGR